MGRFSTLFGLLAVLGLLVGCSSPAPAPTAAPSLRRLRRLRRPAPAAKPAAEASPAAAGKPPRPRRRPSRRLRRSRLRPRPCRLPLLQAWTRIFRRSTPSAVKVIPGLSPEILAGAKREGALSIYRLGYDFPNVAYPEFNKLFPFVKITDFEATSAALLQEVRLGGAVGSNRGGHRHER